MTENENLYSAIRSAREWAGSPQGREAIREAVEKAKESNIKFSESLRVDPKLLKEPFTI